MAGDSSPDRQLDRYVDLFGPVNITPEGRVRSAISSSMCLFAARAAPCTTMGAALARAITNMPSEIDLHIYFGPTAGSVDDAIVEADATCGRRQEAQGAGALLGRRF